MSDGLEQDSKFMNLYSRQIGAYGMETMQKLVKLRVLIVGLKGLGVETAKNLILAGPGQVTLMDDEPTQIHDLGANFFLTEDDATSQRPRAAACVSKLQELNGMVKVATASGPLTEDVVAAHDLLLLTDASEADQLRWNAFCHAKGIKFIASGTLGGAGYVFVDYGDAFPVRDADGENPIVRVVTDIRTSEDGEVTIDRSGRMHNLDVDSDHSGWVKISGVEGMDGKDGGPSINDAGPFRVKAAFVDKTVEEKGERKTKKVFDPYTLKLGDLTGFTDYKRGGIVTQVKQPFTRSFRPLEQALQQPISPGEFMLPFSDGTKWMRAEQLHIARRALERFRASTGSLPPVGDAAAANEVVALAQAVNKEAEEARKAAGDDTSALAVDELDEGVVRKLAMYAGAELQPMCAFFGGIVAQEIVKVTGKFTPLNQWLLLDAFEVLPKEPAADAAAIGSRYDHQISVFGRAFQEKLANSKTFMVGCGALGCEFLKNFALMGVAAGDKGLVTVTDNDRIEVSNLNRQFLFREHNVGQPKSVAAADAVVAMNPALRVKAMESLVCPDTEPTFNDQFWEAQDFVTNALDNVKARLYVDDRCVFYEKPLLESGTLGTKCNVQVILPHKTESYSDHKDAEDQDNIPMCTLRNFPSLIDHCIEWARAQFTDLFVTPFADATKFVEDKEEYLAALKRDTVALSGGARSNAIMKALPNLRTLVQTLREGKGVTFDTCLTQAKLLFVRLFNHRIRDLTHHFPADAKDPKTGEMFWTGTKRFPTPTELDPSDPQHAEFVTAVANLLAVNYGVQPPPDGPETLVPDDSPLRDKAALASKAAAVTAPSWEPPATKAPPTDEDADDEEMETAAADGNEEAEFHALLREAEAFDPSDVKFEPADFEKDEDRNFHIDFIAAAANLRATNYKIDQASRHTCKMIAGKIIPAVATTTASVTGLIMLELYKLMQGKEMEEFRNSSNNLGTNLYLFSEPMPPQKAKDTYDHVAMEEVKCVPPGFTKWDKTIVDAGRRLTVGELVEEIGRVTGLKCTSLYHAVAETHAAQTGSAQMHYEYESRASVKERLASYKDRDVLELIHELYEEPTGVEILSENRTYITLSVELENEEDTPCKVPTLVYKFPKA